MTSMACFGRVIENWHQIRIIDVQNKYESTLLSVEVNKNAPVERWHDVEQEQNNDEEVVGTVGGLSSPDDNHRDKSELERPDQVTKVKLEKLQNATGDVMSKNEYRSLVYVLSRFQEGSEGG
ncbi:hypothetical protein DFH94DRAFT_685100 [Russula ochroleuca]|uniref:Uncharacterized protein n=1 Tax=Russula ochroleuca TaxID=152965 RepID=A0A9P5MR15_9AGAM|nr:hypothetical protein DFH94DRAFT_685100 [Russula ochroleuca]